MSSTRRGTFGTGVDADGNLTRVGIVPRPLQQPHPPLYAPFSYSMETAKFWAREGGKMVSLVPKDKEDFLKLSFDLYLEEAHRVGRRATPADAIAIGGLLILGRTPAEAKDLYAGSEALFNCAYNAPPYHVPMGRLRKGSPQELLDHVSSLAERFGVNEFFLVHHVGYFTQEQELAMLELFADSVIAKTERESGSR